jgi:hypothetical protein
VAIPSTKYFCRVRKTNTLGKIETIDIARILFQETKFDESIDIRSPWETVNFETELIKIF